MPKHFDPDPQITVSGWAADTISELTSAAGVTIDSLLVKDGGIVAAGTLDANGNEIILDAGATTSITADTNNQIDIKINSADDFQFTANTFTALSGSTIATNTIAETTAASGVTIDGVLVKDGGAVFADGAAIDVDTVNEATAGAGVTLDGVLLKDTAISARTAVLAITADGAITVPNHNKVYFFTKAGVAAMTIVDPTATTHDGVTLTFVATTANANTVSNAAGSGFFSSGGATKDVATFGGAIGDGFTIIAYQGKWYIDPRGVTNVTLG